MSKNGEKESCGFRAGDVTVSMTRRDCFSGEESVIDGVLSLIQSERFGWVISLQTMANIGYCYFGVHGRMSPNAFEHGWRANVGRSGEYDDIHISSKEMQCGLTALGVIASKD